MPTNTPPLSDDTTVHTLIIDTDPGADDVIALLLAMASPERLKIRALTTVAGNVPLAKTSRNARLAREWGRRPDIPVHGGAQRPLLRTPIYAADIHGSEGITGVQVHEPAQPLAEGHAVDYLIDTLRAAPAQSVTLAMLGPQITRWDQLRTVQPRTGNRSANNAPRNTYRTADGQWVAVSTSAQSIAERVMRLVGRPELIDEPWFARGVDRAQHADELDAAVGGWIAERTRDEVVTAFEEAQAAVAPIYDAHDIVDDPQFRALGTIYEIDDPELGPLLMQGPLFRLSGHDGVIRHTGRPHGADTDAVLAELGFAPGRVAALRSQGAV